MKKRIVYIIYIISVFLDIQCFADNPTAIENVTFETILTTDGLSHNNITCIFQDSHGFLWFGTNSGLNRYDGKKFIVFKNHPNDINTISSNTILGICEDKEQNIWVATNYGLTKIERETFKCTRIFTDTSTSYIHEYKIIQSIFCDKKGDIWVKMPKTVARMNAKDKTIQRYKIPSDYFDEDIDLTPYPIYEDSYGIIWFGTNNGLGYFEPTINDLMFLKKDDRLSNFLSDNRVLSIFEDSEHRLWIGTENGLNLFNRNTKLFKSYYYSNNFRSTINGIAEGFSPNELWLTTKFYGIYKFNIKTQTFTEYPHNAQRQSISTNKTNCIIKSLGEILWIGTKNGLNKYDTKPKHFLLLSNENNNNKNLNQKIENYTTAIHVSNNVVFFGTKNEGLQIYDMNNHSKQILSAYNGNFPTNDITTITQLSKSEIIIGSTDHLYIYNIISKKYYPIYEKFPALKSMYNNCNRITSLLCDSHGNIWIGTYFGIVFIDTKKNVLKIITKDVLPANHVTCMFEEHRSKIFIGTENGLCYYDYKTDSITKIDFRNHLSSSKLYTFIFDITEDVNGNIWIGSNVGLIKCQIPDFKQYKFYSTTDGLPSNEIHSILTYKDELWIGSDNGLSSFIPDSNIVKTFYPHHGLQDYEFSPHSAFKTANGYMFFGGSKGINVFHPDSIYTNSIVPILEFLDLEYIVNNEKYKIKLHDNQKIEIPYNNSNINISFIALEYTHPERNKYKYFIKGQSSEWTDLNDQNFINIVKMPSGHYTLEIIGSNDDGLWSDIKTIDIEVSTPFWKQTWAFVIEIILTILILFFIIRRKTKTLRTANRRLLEKQYLSQKLETQQKELELKNKSILDSITYAKRIQQAIMPARAKFRQILPSSFILYLPKDIVSGDFYWITEIDSMIFIVCADSTGHGVPGAFMSIIGYNLLVNITNEHNIFKASEILDYLNKSLIELLSKNELEDKTSIKDGMDISICVFHKDTCILEYAGALSKMVVVRNNQLLTYRGDKFTVGLSNEQDDLFTNKIIRVLPNDRFYMFSDGYADQFGGEHGKKLKQRRFFQYIKDCQNIPIIKQGRELNKKLNQWKGKLEQLDDVLVLGFDFNNFLEEKDKTETDLKDNQD